MTAHRRVITRVLALVGTLVVASTGVLMAAVPAQAASEYRYWSYWHVAAGGAAWTYAGTGPGGFRVDDGAVEGWRFAVAAPNPSGPTPRTAASGAFAAICGSTPRPDGADRVALVVDFGTADDAPPRESPPGGVRGTCVVVPDRSNGADVLATAGYAPRQDSSGLLCSLSGYPARECGVVVSAPAPAPSPSARATTTPGPTAKPRVSPGARSSAGATVPGSSGAPAATPRATDDSPLPPTPSRSATPDDVTSSPSSASPEPALMIGPPPPPPAGPSDPPAGLLLGVGLVAVVGVAALARGRSTGAKDPS